MKREPKVFVDMDVEEEERPQGDRSLCLYAEQFLEWAEELCTAHTSSAVKIAQGKVLLLDKYYDWRNFVPKRHRLHTSGRGHFCIFHVMDYAYRRLRLAELAQTPPMLFVPEKPRSNPPTMLEGTILGLAE